MNKIYKSNIALTLWRIALMYIVITLCQVIFYLYNKSLIDGLTIKDSDRLKAAVQQYYQHVSKHSYLVPDNK